MYTLLKRKRFLLNSNLWLDFKIRKQEYFPQCGTYKVLLFLEAFIFVLFIRIFKKVAKRLTSGPTPYTAEQYTPSYTTALPQFFHPGLLILLLILPMANAMQKEYTTVNSSQFLLGHFSPASILISEGWGLWCVWI